MLCPVWFKCGLARESGVGRRGSMDSEALTGVASTPRCPTSSQQQTSTEILWCGICSWRPVGESKFGFHYTRDQGKWSRMVSVVYPSQIFLFASPSVHWIAPVSSWISSRCLCAFRLGGFQRHAPRTAPKLLPASPFVAGCN